jgi:hypothetical protein
MNQITEVALPEFCSQRSPSKAEYRVRISFISSAASPPAHTFHSHKTSSTWAKFSSGYSKPEFGEGNAVLIRKSLELRSSENLLKH